MEQILDRFLRYVAVDTQSNEDSESQPSTPKQLNLLKLLCKELTDLGVEATLDEYGYVMGRIPGNLPAGAPEVPAIGFIAHVDTAPDASGENVKPQIIKNYDGSDIPLKGVPGLVLKTSSPNCWPTRAKPSLPPTAPHCSAPTTRPALRKSWTRCSISWPIRNSNTAPCASVSPPTRR